MADVKRLQVFKAKPATKKKFSGAKSSKVFPTFVSYNTRALEPVTAVAVA